MAGRDGRFGISAVPVSVLGHLLAIAIATLVLIWVLNFRGGVALNSNNKQKIFNVHPMLMVIGFILVGGEAIMAYKTIPSTREAQKPVHAILHLIALVVGALGVYAVFKFHHELNIRHMYTLHSWLGISTISLFALQFIFAFFSFVFPGAESRNRANIAPWLSFSWELPPQKRGWFRNLQFYVYGVDNKLSL